MSRRRRRCASRSNGSIPDKTETAPSHPDSRTRRDCCRSRHPCSRVSAPARPGSWSSVRARLQSSRAATTSSRHRCCGGARGRSCPNRSSPFVEPHSTPAPFPPSSRRVQECDTARSRLCRIRTGRAFPEAVRPRDEFVPTAVANRRASSGHPVAVDWPRAWQSQWHPCVRSVCGRWRTH